MAKTKARKIMDLLNNAPGMTDKQVAAKAKCHPNYVGMIRKKMVHVEPCPEQAPLELTEDMIYDEAAETTGGLAEFMERWTAADPYSTLLDVLSDAYGQAAIGKGKERHANGNPWTEQPIFTIAQQVGDGFNAGQTIKKVQEAQQMAARGEYEKAQHEILGAIVYAASLHVIWGKKGI